MNKAICLKKENDKHFTGNGTEYQCGNAYAKFETAVVDVIDNNGNPIVVDINDSDFVFIFENNRSKGENCMNNQFENKTDEELRTLYEQYKEFQKTGIIPDNELGKIRDELYEKFNAGWHVIMMQYLLEVIAERWVNKI